MKRLCNLYNTKKLGQILTTAREFNENIDNKHICLYNIIIEL